MHDPDTSRKPVKNVAGAIAMVVAGLVILIPSGLCTGIMGVGALVEMFANPRNSDGIFMIIMPLVVGGPFVIGGAALIWHGVRNFRERD